LDGKEWKDRRTKLSPIFTSGKIKMMFEIVEAIGDKFLKAVDKEIITSENIDIAKILAKYSTVGKNLNLLKLFFLNQFSGCDFKRRFWNRQQL
jgi:Cytochrome P450